MLRQKGKEPEDDFLLGPSLLFIGIWIRWKNGSRIPLLYLYYYIIYSYIHIYKIYIYFTIMFLYNYIFYILYYLFNLNFLIFIIILLLLLHCPALS